MSTEQTHIQEEPGVFISAVLTPESHQELLRRVPPQHAVVYAHHATMAFKPDPATLAYYRQFAGQRVHIAVLAFAADDKAQAVLVSLPACENEYPHITISVAEGVEARYSNDLFKIVGIHALHPLKVFKVEADVVIEPLESLLPTDSGGPGR